MSEVVKGIMEKRFVPYMERQLIEARQDRDKALAQTDRLARAVDEIVECFVVDDMGSNSPVYRMDRAVEFDQDTQSAIMWAIEHVATLESE